MIAIGYAQATYLAALDAHRREDVVDVSYAPKCWDVTLVWVGIMR